jgi:putative nucleotidyltransferase with HDIG domain
MTIPGREDAAALLLSLDPPTWFLRHSRAVAEIAAWLAARASDSGAAVDRSLVEAGALLHDVDKLLGAADPARALSHGEGSAAWLRRRGHPELAPVVAHHAVTFLLDGAAFERWIGTAAPEARIVAYADKRGGQRLEPIAARFASWERRYPGSWSVQQTEAVRRRARHLEADVCGLARVPPADVRRLAWTGLALRRARARVDSAA